jgi:hypothetical protein
MLANNMAVAMLKNHLSSLAYLQVLCTITGVTKLRKSPTLRQDGEASLYMKNITYYLSFLSAHPFNSARVLPCFGRFDQAQGIAPKSPTSHPLTPLAAKLNTFF